MTSSHSVRYVTPNSYNYGKVPPLWPLPGGRGGAWDRIDAAHSRLPALKHRPPDYVVNAEGFNDQVCSGWAGYTCTNADITRSVEGWIASIRNVTTPHTPIIVLAPFGGALRTQNRTRFAIKAGVQSYVAAATAAAAAAAAAAATPSITAPLQVPVFFVDIYPRGQRGLKGACASGTAPAQSSGQPPGPTAESCDGTHPLGWKHAELAAMVTAAVVQATAPHQHQHQRQLQL